MVQCCILLRLSLNSAMAIPGAGETSAVRPKFAAAVALPEAVTGRVGRHRSTRLCDGTPRRAVSPKPHAHTRRTAHFQRQRSAPAIIFTQMAGAAQGRRRRLRGNRSPGRSSARTGPQDRALSRSLHRAQAPRPAVPVGRSCRTHHRHRRSSPVLWRWTTATP